MATFTIQNQDLASLKDKVVVVTGGSSGIGLATTELLLSLGAKIANGDMSPPKLEHANLAFVQTNVARWDDLVALFKRAHELYGRIDHVHANAGISTRANYFEDKYSESGELLEPSSQVLDVNLKGVVNTVYLGMHYMRHQQPPGGSIVMTASASSFQRFRVTDYTTAKHAVLGFMRGLVPSIEAEGLPVRVNTLAPDWTHTGIVPEVMQKMLGEHIQGPDVIAQAACCCMSDGSRQGQLIYTKGGIHKEVEESVLQGAAKEIIGRDLAAADTLDGQLKSVAAGLEKQLRAQQG